MAVVGAVFIDTSVLIGGIIDVGPAVRDAQAIMRAVARGALADRHTAWHCCLEFVSVATRLPPTLRLSPGDAVRLVQDEILGRFRVHDLGAKQRQGFLDAVAADRIAGGRVYDAHIAEVARRAGADIVVTENPRHFGLLRRHGVRVLTSSELCSEGRLER